jgi:SulP family sulfate permease
MKKYINLFDFTQKVNYKTEVLAGLTVAMTMIPESLSFAILAGFPPLMGLYAAIIAGFVTAVFGGRPGMISGGAGATVITLIALFKSHGLDFVLAAVALAGVFQIAVGVFKLAKFIRLVPHPVMFGFVNGLAIVIFSSQLEQFKTIINHQVEWLSGSPLYIMLALVALTIAIVLLFPKITKAVPSSLVAIIVVFLLVYFFGIDTKTVSDIASVSGGFPPLTIPNIPVTWETFEVIAPYAMVMAAVGLTEGLLTLNLVDEITQTKGNGNRECIAQGGSNILNGFFFGMGGCPMIAQTLVNLSAGSRARLSGIVASLAILAIVLFGAPLIELVPMAALVGVMIMVAIGTFEWVSLKIFNKIVQCIVAPSSKRQARTLSKAFKNPTPPASVLHAWRGARGGASFPPACNLRPSRNTGPFRRSICPTASGRTAPSPALRSGAAWTFATATRRSRSR